MRQYTQPWCWTPASTVTRAETRTGVIFLLLPGLCFLLAPHRLVLQHHAVLQTRLFLKCVRKVARRRHQKEWGALVRRLPLQLVSVTKQLSVSIGLVLCSLSLPGLSEPWKAGVPAAPARPSPCLPLAPQSPTLGPSPHHSSRSL